MASPTENLLMIPHFVSNKLQAHFLDTQGLLKV